MMRKFGPICDAQTVMSVASLASVPSGSGGPLQYRLMDSRGRQLNG